MTMACLLWLDVETTGLDPKRESLLEVGAIVTDERLVELGRFSSLVRPRDGALDGMIPVVREMHEGSGLLEELRAGAPAWGEVRRRFMEFVEARSGGGGDVYLAGSSVHFDRSFLAEALPELLPRMSHRVLDVSTLKVIAKLWRPELEGFRMGRPPAHRVIEDLEASMAELRHWGSVLLRAGTGPVEALSLLG